MNRRVARPMRTEPGAGHHNHAVRADSRSRGHSASAKANSKGPRPSELWDKEASIARSYKTIEEVYGKDWRDERGA